MFESGQQVHFKQGHRTDALNLALNINKGKKTAALHAIKAFFRLKVEIQPSDKNEGYLKKFVTIQHPAKNAYRNSS